MVRKLLDLGNNYAKSSTWVDYALVKFCLCAMGIIIGVNIPAKHRDKAAGFAAGVFICTYVPLMSKVFRIAEEMFSTEK